MSNQFFIVVVVTIATTRVFLFLRPIPGPTIHGLRVHHYMYGMVAILAGILVRSVVVYGIGAGLFGDELTYLLIGGKSHRDNYSRLSLVGTLLIVIAVFFLRAYLVRPLEG